MNKKIVELKNKLGLSRATFAKAFDISPSQMARIEYPSIRKFIKTNVKDIGNF